MPDYLKVEDLPVCPTEVNGRCKIHVDNIRPTQRNIGYTHMERRAKKLNKLFDVNGISPIDDIRKLKTTEFIVGPGNDVFINDRHHFSNALIRSNVPHKQKFVVGKVVANYSSKSEYTFWRMMKLNNWALLLDADFKPIHYETLPKHLLEMNDNPYRSPASRFLKSVNTKACELPFLIN